jgi:uncharacterized membrane protein YhaH (DUF805 family)
MMRFFNPGHPAGRLEFFVVSFVIAASLVAFNILFLSFTIVFETAVIEYDATMVTAFFAAYIVASGLQWINVIRRLKDLHMNGAWSLMLIAPILSIPALPFLVVALPVDWVEAVILSIPAAQIFFIMFLTFSRGMSRQTYTPYGDNPYDPDSWVPKGVSVNGGPAGKAVTFNGQELRLPGEGSQEAA